MTEVPGYVSSARQVLIYIEDKADIIKDKELAELGRKVADLADQLYGGSCTDPAQVSLRADFWEIYKCLKLASLLGEVEKQNARKTAFETFNLLLGIYTAEARNKTRSDITYLGALNEVRQSRLKYMEAKQ